MYQECAVLGLIPQGSEGELRLSSEGSEGGLEGVPVWDRSLGAVGDSVLCTVGDNIEC